MLFQKPLDFSILTFGHPCLLAGDSEGLTYVRLVCIFGFIFHSNILFHSLKKEIEVCIFFPYSSLDYYRNGTLHKHCSFLFTNTVVFICTH